VATTPKDRTVNIELTNEQVSAAESVDDSPWTPEVMDVLAGEAFGKLDDTDYSEYLRDDELQP
jgi:hypothetical protein